MYVGVFRFNRLGFTEVPGLVKGEDTETTARALTVRVLAQE